MSRILTILLIFTINSVAQGQYIPPSRTDLRLVKNLENFISRAMPWLENEGAKKKAVNSINSKYSRIKDQLEWNPESGYLIRVRVEKNLISGAHTPMTPEFLGFGEQPISVLTRYYSNPSITTAPSSSPTMVLDNSKSFYVWVENKKTLYGLGPRKLKYGLIPSLYYSAMNKEALRVASNQDLLEAFKTNHRSHVFRGVMNKLNKNAKTEEARNNLIQLEQSLSKTETEINALKSELNNALEGMNRANKALESINTLKDIVSLATLTMQVKSAVSDLSSDKLNNVTGVEDLIEITEVYEVTLKDRSVQYERQLKINNDNYLFYKSELQKIFGINNVPNEVTTEALLY